MAPFHGAATHSFACLAFQALLPQLDLSIHLSASAQGRNIHCISNISKILNYIYMNGGLILVKNILSIFIRIPGTKLP